MKKVNIDLINNLNSEIRKNKISNLLQSKKFTPNNYNVPNDIIKVMEYFSKWGAITGSSLYALYGFIDRVPNDIDLLVDKDILSELESHFIILQNHEYDFTPINSIGYINFDINNKNYKIDIILTDDISYTKFHNKIRLDNLFKSIQMKTDLYKESIDRGTYKDEDDLNNILSILKGVEVPKNNTFLNRLFSKDKPKKESVFSRVYRALK